MKTIRIYGPTGTYTSHATVTRGFELATKAHGSFAGTYSLNDIPDWEEDIDDEGAMLGANADIGILTGRLDSAHLMKRWGNHKQRFAMVAPNSSALPTKLMDSLNYHCTGLLAPSKWALDVVKRYTNLPTYLAPHGVCPEFIPNPPEAQIRRLQKQYDNGEFNVFHFTTSDKARKGTSELVAAWKLCRDRKLLPDGAKLYMVLDTHAARAHAHLFDGAAQHNILRCQRANAGKGLTPQQMFEVLSNCHLVAQPSRGEGFGLIPLQAASVGTPVLMTGCTGHSEHRMDCTERGAVITGLETLIDDLPTESSVAPSLLVEDVARVLANQYENWAFDKREMSLHSLYIYSKWQWSRILAPFLDEVTK